jgi:peptide deformylase
VDHLQGILFIDRMDKKTKEDVRDEIELIMAETKAALKT